MINRQLDSIGMEGAEIDPPAVPQPQEIMLMPRDAHSIDRIPQAQWVDPTDPEKGDYSPENASAQGDENKICNGVGTGTSSSSSGVDTDQGFLPVLANAPNASIPLHSASTRKLL